MIRRSCRGFTMVELLVSTAVIALLVLMLAGITNQASLIWRQTTTKAEQFREARMGFEAMTSHLGQATLNTYWGYDDLEFPTRFERRSELRFISGPARELMGVGPGGRERPTHCVFFQAPFGHTEQADFKGFENLLSALGYYVELNEDAAFRPPFLSEDHFPARYRYRLMEMRQPAEGNTIYARTSGEPLYAGREWFLEPLAMVQNAPVHVLAENIIALIITPRLAKADELEVKGLDNNVDSSPLAPDYLYDTSPVASGGGDGRYRDARLNPVHQLPPLIQVTMVAIDENSAIKLDFYAGTRDPFAISQRFLHSINFTRDLTVNGDAASLENTLAEMNVSYRIMTTTIALRGAKWSREQTSP